jgi:hypothetical protein
MQNDIVCHEIVRRPSYWSNIFSTQIFQELLQLEVTIDGDRLVLTRVQSVPAQSWQRWRGRLAGTQALQAHVADHADEVRRERLS